MSMDSCEALAAAGALLGPARSANPAAWFDGASMPRLWLNANGAGKSVRTGQTALVRCNVTTAAYRVGLAAYANDSDGLLSVWSER